MIVIIHIRPIIILSLCYRINYFWIDPGYVPASFCRKKSIALFLEVVIYFLTPFNSQLDPQMNERLYSMKIHITRLDV